MDAAGRRTIAFTGLILAGMDVNEIATDLERTVSAVRARAERKLRVSLKRVMVARRSPG